MTRGKEDLDAFIDLYTNFEEGIDLLMKENEALKVKTVMQRERLLFTEDELQTVKNTIQEVTEMNRNLQAALSNHCSIQEENERLKHQQASLKELVARLEKESSNNVEAAAKEMQHIKDNCEREINEIRKQCKQSEKAHEDRHLQLAKAMESAEKEHQEKVLNLENERHAQIVKLRLEYDTKLLKLQNQSNRTSDSAQPKIKEEIFRKKLQHAQSQADKEISSLKRRIAELEKRLEEQPGKRRKIYFEG